MNRTSPLAIALLAIVTASASSLHAQAAERPAPFDTLRSPEIQNMVARLDLEKYKATVKGLSHGREIAMMATKTGTDAAEVLQKRTTESIDELKAFACKSAA